MGLLQGEKSFSCLIEKADKKKVIELKNKTITDGKIIFKEISFDDFSVKQQKRI